MHPVARAYDERPLLIFWEMTRACPLACAHCRARAQHTPMPGELTTEEGIRFLLVSGVPLGEPVAWYGPIVMNTQSELRQAFEELEKGTFLTQ